MDKDTIGTQVRSALILTCITVLITMTILASMNAGSDYEKASAFWSSVAPGWVWLLVFGFWPMVAFLANVWAFFRVR